MQAMTVAAVDYVARKADVAMRERFGERVITEDDLPAVVELFGDSLIGAMRELGMELNPGQVQAVCSAYADTVPAGVPGPWARGENVIDWKPHYERAVVERGEGGYFANCPDDPAALLQELGVGDGPFAIGLNKPTKSEPGEPEMEGWALTPTEARQLAQVLIEKADECEKGWP